jgi:glycosyltransferase involved in cell wall biosynthesis
MVKMSTELTSQPKRRCCFAIITATYNAAFVLPRLLESLAEQTCRDFELILQDGNSTDATVALAETFRCRLPFLSLRSEPDGGIYDAFNKALDRASGQWILFLGADDFLKSAITLQQIKDKMQNCSQDTLFACGGLDMLSSQGVIAATVLPQIANAWNLMRQGQMPSGNPALLYNHCLFTKERFDTSFLSAGDYDFICRVWSSAHAIDLGFTVTCMGAGGISQSIRTTYIARRETYQVLRLNFPEVPLLGRHIFSIFIGYILHLSCVLLGETRTISILQLLRRWRRLLPARSCNLV